MTRYVPIAGYLLAIIATVLVWNFGPGATGWFVGIGIWACASILLGAVTGRISFSLWAFVAIPIAYPFGAGDGYRYSEPLPLWFGAAVYSLGAAGLIFAAALARKVADRHIA